MTTPTISPRHPLGLPAGSVRALLAFMVLGLMWAVLLAPAVEPVGVPLYLYYLLFLILGHYFAAHGHSIAGPTTGTKSPLYLPRGSVRGLILFGFAGMVAWHFATGGDFHN